MKENYKTLMIPTESSNIVLHQISKKLDYLETEFSLQEGKNRIPQHLYVVDTKDVIKENDWFIGEENTIIHASKEIYEDLFSLLNDANSSCRRSKGKIIASTDASLKLPVIGKLHIEHFIKEWNKENEIKLEKLVDNYYNYEYSTNKETGLNNNIYDLALENANRMLALPDAKDNLTILLKNAFIAGASYQINLDNKMKKSS